VNIPAGESGQTVLFSSACLLVAKSRKRLYKFAGRVAMMIKKNMLLAACLIFITALLHGCGGGLSKMVKEQDSPDTALLFGYIDMDDAPSNLESVSLRQYAAKDGEPYIPMRADGEGLFYRENVPKGSYGLYTFGGRGWTLGCGSFMKQRYYYNFPDEGFKYSQFRLANSGPFFLGSYKMKKIKGKYEFEDADSPTEKELLTRLLAYTGGTKWENVIKKRLKQL
jgi:hypothetical protein